MSYNDFILKQAKALYALDGYELIPVSEHEGGRNDVFECRRDGRAKYILRISATGDRTHEDYLAETEFVRFLAKNHAPVADVIPSVNDRLCEPVSLENKECFVSLFEYAPGMLISDNGYRYRDGAPLSEYFYNTGKTLGCIHRLSKLYTPVHKRCEFSDKYNMNYIGSLMGEGYDELKEALTRKLALFDSLDRNKENYGLVHFDFSDGNYHIDMSTGRITVFDLDNCMYCHYMFDLANLWVHGIGWCMGERDIEKRQAFMNEYFDTIVAGYRSETDISAEDRDLLPLFIDMVLTENIVDEFECSAREGERPDYEDIAAAANCLINNIPYAGYFV